MQSSTRGDVDPFIVMDVMEKARQAEEDGRHIIHMEVGQPGTSAPSTARDYLSAKLDDPLGYTVALGLPELRQKIANLYQVWYGLDIDPARVVVTSGSSGAFLLAFTALFDEGARVAIGEPGYPSYRNILKALSIEALGVQSSPENRYQPTAQQFENIDKLDGMLIASPANPTGTMLDHQAQKSLIDFAQNQGIAYISDEIYHGIQYEGRAISALEISDDVYVINSFSKYFSMTGWRVGWMIVPQNHVRKIERLAQNMFICPPHASQLAALGAMDAKEELEANQKVYAENRRLLLDALPKMGFGKIAPPDGAFYVYADVSKYTSDSNAFCSEILKRAGVAVTPGLDFDPQRGHQTIRFSYARSTNDIKEGIKRLAEFMKGLN